MVIQKSTFYTYSFSVILLLQIFLPSFRTNIILQASAIFLYLIFDKFKITKGFLKIITPIVLIFLLGFIGFILHGFSTFNALKDIFHSIKPVLGLFIGYAFFKEVNNFKLFVKTIVICGFLSAIWHFTNLILSGSFFTGSVNAIREYGRDSFLELFALFMLLFYYKFYKETLFKNKLFKNFILYLLLFSCFLYFSRTMIVTAILLFLSIKGFTKITKKTIQLAASFVVLILLFYAFLFSVKIERNKPGLETLLFKIKIAPAEIFKTKIDRDDHKDLWDHWRGYEAKRAFDLMNDYPSSYVFGCGHGSLVNLKFYAPLSGPGDKGMKYISELHNGYPYILYKSGFLGMVLYLFFILKLYVFAYQNKNYITIFISAIGLFYLFSTLTITGIYNANDVVIFILGGFLFYNYKRQFKTQPTNLSI
jgi:hypothetical protein